MNKRMYVHIQIFPSDEAFADENGSSEVQIFRWTSTIIPQLPNEYNISQTENWTNLINKQT